MHLNWVSDIAHGVNSLRFPRAYNHRQPERRKYWFNCYKSNPQNKTKTSPVLQSQRRRQGILQQHLRQLPWHFLSRVTVSSRKIESGRGRTSELHIFITSSQFTFMTAVMTEAKTSLILRTASGESGLACVIVKRARRYHNSTRQQRVEYTSTS